MTTRHHALGPLLEGLEAAFLRQEFNGPLRDEVTGTFRALDHSRPAGGAVLAWIEACDHLQPALKLAAAAGGDARVISDAFKRIAPELAWGRRKNSAEAGAAFHDGHANAIVIGPEGLEMRDDIWLGVSLIEPGIQYPMHRHPPEELYIVMSDGEWYREGDGWFRPGPGGIVHKPGGHIHSMRAGDTPLLAFWLLWKEGGVSL